MAAESAPLSAPPVPSSLPGSGAIEELHALALTLDAADRADLLARLGPVLWQLGLTVAGDWAERDTLRERVRVLESNLAEEQRQYDRLQAKLDGQDPGCHGCTRREAERDEARERDRVLEAEREALINERDTYKFMVHSPKQALAMCDAFAEVYAERNAMMWGLGCLLGNAVALAERTEAARARMHAAAENYLDRLCAAGADRDEARTHLATLQTAAEQVLALRLPGQLLEVRRLLGNALAAIRSSAPDPAGS